MFTKTVTSHGFDILNMVLTRTCGDSQSSLFDASRSASRLSALSADARIFSGNAVFEASSENMWAADFFGDVYWQRHANVPYMT
jgi:hypothetical protein